MDGWIDNTGQDDIEGSGRWQHGYMDGGYGALEMAGLETCDARNPFESFQQQHRELQEGGRPCPGAMKPGGFLMLTESGEGEGGISHRLRTAKPIISAEMD